MGTIVPPEGSGAGGGVGAVAPAGGVTRPGGAGGSVPLGTFGTDVPADPGGGGGVGEGDGVGVAVGCGDDGGVGVGAGAGLKPTTTVRIWSRHPVSETPMLARAARWVRPVVPRTSPSSRRCTSTSSG